MGSNKVQWRRYYTSADMDTVTAMAISPDLSNIAVYGGIYNANVWKEYSFIFLIRTNDGGHVNNALKLTFG